MKNLKIIICEEAGLLTRDWYAFHECINLRVGMDPGLFLAPWELCQRLISGANAQTTSREIKSLPHCHLPMMKIMLANVGTGLLRNKLTELMPTMRDLPRLLHRPISYQISLLLECMNDTIHQQWNHIYTFKLWSSFPPSESKKLVFPAPGGPKSRVILETKLTNLNNLTNFQ